LNDYIQPDNDEGEKDKVYLTIEDIDKLVPGMWLKCLYDDYDDDETLYEAMFLTTDAGLMNPFTERTPGSYNELIGIEYHKEGLDEGDDAQKWVPISWCIPDKVHVNQCDIHQSSSDSTCDYLALNDSVEAIFRRAFKDITMLKKQQSKESCSESSSNEKVLFTYSQHGGDVYKDKNTGYLVMGSDDLALPAEMDTSTYSTIYSALLFSDPEIQQVDNKLKLYQLYKNDPLASAVFPKSYSSYVGALLDTDETGEDIFYIKDAGATRGEDIYIKTRDELANDYQERKEEGEYDLVSGEGDIIDEGDVIIQRAVTDLYTVDGDGPISGARFDIRYYLIISDGKVYLHSNMVFKWPLGLKYDPTNTNFDDQVVKDYYYKPGMIKPTYPETPLKDEYGNKWNNSQRKRRRSSTTGEFRKADMHGWRDAVADALDDASGVFKNLKELTKADPTKYVLAGGDAMIKEDGSAVIVEFNVWPDLAGPYKRLTKCLSGEKCHGMFLQIGESADNYIVTEPTVAAEIVSSEAFAEVMRDMISMVMKVQPADEIEGLREIRIRA